MEKWEKLEDFINQLIQKLALLFSGKAKSVTPKKIIDKAERSKASLLEKKGKVIASAEVAKKKGAVGLMTAKEKASQVQLKTIELIAKMKTMSWRDLKISKIIAILTAFLAPPLLKLKSWYLNLKPTQIASFVTLSTVATLASVNIYVQTNKISEESRSPASELVEEVDRATEISRRPAYFKSKEKQFQVTNIVLPAYTQQKGAVRKLVIDFTFESSNKYIKNYLWENSHLIQDTLNSQIEPITITFPLEEEGKTIVKEKIIKEMNKKLKSLKIKGEIKSVYIHSMIAG